MDSTPTRQARVTRMGILDLVEDAFGRDGATRSDILQTARDNRADLPTLATLERLQDRRFRSVRDLWTDLPDVPVE